MIRRDFIVRMAGGATALALGGDVRGQAKHHPVRVNMPDKRDRISISTWRV